jgi:hypothetical protein
MHAAVSGKQPACGPRQDCQCKSSRSTEAKTAQQRCDAQCDGTDYVGWVCFGFVSSADVTGLSQVGAHANLHVMVDVTNVGVGSLHKQNLFFHKLQTGC